MSKIKINKKLIIILVLLLVLVCTRGFTYARYVSNAMFNYYLNSKGFYFESEDLSIDGNNIVDTMWNGEPILFSVNNFSNKGASEFDIEYEVSCEVLEDETKTCLINGEDGKYVSTLSAYFGCSINGYLDEGTCVENDGKWNARQSTSELNFTVVADEGVELLGAKVKVTVTSVKPYKKSISATYDLIKDSELLGGLTMKYEISDIKSKLIVANSYNEAKCVAVSWDPDKFTFDNDSNEYIGVKTDDNGMITTAYFQIGKLNSKLLEFYVNSNGGNYSEKDFSLVESNLCN